MATSNSGDKGTRNLVIIMVGFIVTVGVVFFYNKQSRQFKL